MFSLWADESMSSCGVYMHQYETYTFYVFLEPGPDGAFAAEYKLVLPDSHVSVSWEANDFITSATIGDPAGAPGIAAPFYSCQNSLVWLYKHTVMLQGERTREWIALEPNDDSGNMGIAICPGDRPLADAILYNCLGINRSCCGAAAPWLISAEATDKDQVTATLDRGVEMATSDYFDDHFIVYAEGLPADTIEVIGGEWLGFHHDSCLLDLENELEELRTYRLVAYNMCDVHGDYCDTTEQLFYVSHIATQLQQFSTKLVQGVVVLNWQLSSIDPGTVFLISRRSSDDQFALVGEITGAVEELSFRFEDRSVSGGKTYIYRVEYVSDAGRGILFDTDIIETAAMPVKLAQNHPNPFNPSTTIEFYIPEGGPVSLCVYDVGGRLVRILVNGASEPGNYSVTWPGLDDIGNSVPSGVYFYRLTAGKKTISKKMVLLR